MGPRAARDWYARRRDALVRRRWFPLRFVDEDLEAKRAVWEARPELRKIYAGWHARLAPWLRPGPTVEIGCGMGALRDLQPGIVATDLVPSRWTHVACDATRLPFRDGSLANVVCLDVLHHLFALGELFRGLARALRPGGRFLCVEPWLSPASLLVHRLFHFEPIDFRVALDPPPGRKRPGDANLAIPTAIFGRRARELARRFPELRLVHKSFHDCLVYPLSGGFNRRPVLPPAWLDRLGRVERLLGPVSRLLAYKVFAVLERQP